MGVSPRPLGDRVLLAPLEAQEATTGGVVLPDEARERESRGMVVAAPVDAPVRIGDVVVFAERGSSPYSFPTWVTLDSGESGRQETLVVVDYPDLLLVLDEIDVEAAA